MEIFSTSLGVVCFYFQWAIGGYFVLFLLALQSTLFSPCKYGIIPEIVEKERISHYNGVITATTYLAIILGTFFASFLTQATHQHYVLASTSTLILAIIGTIATLWLPKTAPQAPDKKISFDVFGGIIKALKRSRQHRYLFEAIVYGAYFLFMGAYMQLNMIPFVTQSLGLAEIQGGYLFLMVAVGIGIGSFAAGQLCRDEVELGFVPISTFGIGLVFLLLYIFSSNFYIVIPLLILSGIFGGFFIVPVDIFIQIASPSEHRGQNVATSNFLSFTGVIFASALLALFGNTFKLTSAEGFLAVSLLTFLLALALAVLFADQLLRLLVFFVARIFWKLKVVGKRRLKQGPVLIVGQRNTWFDTLIIMATLPRMIRYIVPIDDDIAHHPLYYRLLKVIPLDTENFSPIGLPALNQIKKEIEAGNSVCLMHPPSSEEKKMKQWRDEVEKWLEGVNVPALPVYIEHEGSVEPSNRFLQFFTLIRKDVKVGYGTLIDQL
ncbi:MAG: Lysophospholipid transporter LplT [Chlamydiales bacterium]|nr:Lysophospholipid transporter LplT [Chlamydiales bacterium]MCH9619538.1 Lysophospholipid transporter LplT [Chlamydiales bacterium]MCH9623144.1 Lysophospholipid transporter LplT [Chlamydiales bacterium]